MQGTCARGGRDVDEHVGESGRSLQFIARTQTTMIHSRSCQIAVCLCAGHPGEDDVRVPDMALHENVVEDQDGVAEVLVVPTEVL
jgi:hypothetical protein